MEKWEGPCAVSGDADSQDPFTRMDSDGEYEYHRVVIKTVRDGDVQAFAEGKLNESQVTTHTNSPVIPSLGRLIETNCFSCMHSGCLD